MKSIIATDLMLITNRWWNFKHFVLDQVKVGDAAQNTAVLVLNMKYLKELSFDAI
jgi:hypothetical protein